MEVLLNSGNLWDTEFLDTVILWNREFEGKVQVASLFGSIAGVTPTARSVDRIPYREWAFLENYIQKALSNGITIRWTLNQSCISSLQDFGPQWPQLKDTCHKLFDLGVHEWTITSPLLMELLREELPGAFLEVSTICELSTPEELERWKKLGADGVNLSTKINRDFNALKAMSKRAQDLGMTPSILAQEACLWQCPWRRECYNLSSHNSHRTNKLFHKYPFQRCNSLRLAEPVEWVKARLILPQWVRRYHQETGIGWYKIAFRTHPKEVALPMLRAYMEEKWEGNLLSLWPSISHLGGTIEPADQCSIPTARLDNGFLDHFIKHGHKCPLMSCQECGYCHQVYQQSQEKEKGDKEIVPWWGTRKGGNQE